MDAGNHTILRAITRGPIEWRMKSAPTIDMEKLRADMSEAVERTSGRNFSLMATGGKNADLYRNFVNNGQDKRLSAEVFFGIVNALGRSPFDYVVGMDDRSTLPSASVLTTTFAVLLDSLAIDPYENDLAQKLAEQFPGVLQSISGLYSGRRAGGHPEAIVPADSEDHQSA